MGLMKKLTSALVASSLVFSLVGSAFAAYTPAAGEEAGARMQKLGIIQGRPEGLALNAEITRAELVTTIVRAMGKEEDAKLLKGSTIFPDIQNHWASGNIAMAVALVEKAGSDPIGMPDGTFAPDVKLTPAQAVAFLMKFVGVKADGTKTWPANYLDVAVEKGIITAEDKTVIAPMLNENATRGLTFYMFDRAFFNYKLADGATFYTKYVDPVKPELNITEPVKTTIDSKITITGKATGATQVFVGTTPVTLGTDGAFTFDVAMPEMKEYPITVTAVDLAGNSTEAKYTVTRTVGTAATIEAKLGAELLKAGTETTLTVSVKDKNGNVVTGAAYDVKVEGEIGTYADGKFTAAAKPATGSLTITSGDATAKLDVAVVAGDVAKIDVTGATVAKVGQALTFAAKGFDAAGNEVALSNVTWSTSAGGVINPSTGEFAGTASGNVTITAKVGEIAGTATVQIFGDAKALALDIPTGLIANQDDVKVVNVKVVDDKGAVVGNSTASVTLTATSGNIQILDANDNAVTQLTVKAVNGVASFNVTQTSGWTATTTSLSAISGTLTGAVGTMTSVAPTVGSVKLTTSATGTIDASGVVTVSAKVMDTTGAQIPAPAAFTVALTNGDAALSTLSTSNLHFTSGQTAPNGSATLTLKGKEGTITLAGTTAAGYTVESASVNTKVAGPAYQLVITSAPKDTNADDAEATIKVAIQDASGTTKIGAAGGTYTMVAKNAKGETKETVTGTLANGILTFAFDELVKTGTMTFSFSATNGLVAPAAVTANVTPGAVAKLGNVLVNDTDTTAGTPVTLVADGAMTATLSVKVLDANDNVVTGATNAVTFKKAANTTATTGVDINGITVNAIDGVAKATITSTINETADSFTVSAKKADGTAYAVGNAGYVSTQIVGLPANIEHHAISSATPKAGADFTVTFKIVDSVGRTVATDNGRAVTLEVLDGDDVVVNTLTGTTASGLAKFTVNLTTVDGYKFKAATNVGSAKSVTTGTIANVRAANPSYVQIVSDLASVENGSNIPNLVSYKVKDIYGNNVAPVATIIDAVNVTGLDYAVNGDSAAAAVNARIPAGTTGRDFVSTGLTADSTFTLSDANGVATVVLDMATDATYTDLPVVATSVSTYNAGPAYMLKLVKELDTLAAGANATVKVGVYDAAGLLKTSVSGDATTGVGQVTLTTLPTYTNQPQTTATQTVDVVRGVATFTLNALNKAGTYKFEATSSTGLVKNNAIAFGVNAGDATQVVVSNITLDANGSSVGLLTFKVADQFGNTVSSYTGNMLFEKKAGSTGATLLTTSAPIVSGKAVAQVQAASVPGTFTVIGTVEGTNTLTTDSVEGAVVVGSLAPLAANSSISKGAEGAAIYVVLKDVNGNPVLNWQSHIKFYDNATPAAVVTGDFTHIGNGVYTATRPVGGVTVNVLNAADTATLVTGSVTP